MSLPSVPFHVAALLALGAFAAAGSARAGEVTIYRCVDGAGKVSLQDRPCPKDVHQDIRQMVRPQDPPPRPQVVASALPGTPPAPPSNVILRVVHVRDPQPLYECRTPDGETYLSQSGVPEGRYVPLWTLGLGNGFANVGGRPDRAPGRRGGRLPPGQFGGAMVYTQDTCVMLPGDEVCRRMHDRDDQLGTLIFNGQPSDRDRYERERRVLAEQQRAQCGAD